MTTVDSLFGSALSYLIRIELLRKENAGEKADSVARTSQGTIHKIRAIKIKGPSQKATGVSRAGGLRRCCKGSIYGGPGKNVCEYLRAEYVDLPNKVLSSGPLR